MATEVKMPKLGMTMTEGTLTKWEKAKGDRVKKGETLCSITTDKVTADIESPEEGILLKIRKTEGDTVPVGGIVAWVGAEGEKAEEIEDETPGASPASSRLEAGGAGFSGPARPSAFAASGTAVPCFPVFGGEEKERPAGPGIAASGTDAMVRATPAARAVARQKGLAIETVIGSGPRGRILRKDVEEAVAAARETPLGWDRDCGGPGWTDLEPSPIRKTAARRMAESFSSAPHFYLTVQVDASSALNMLECARASLGREKSLLAGAAAGPAGSMERSEVKATFSDVLLWILSRVIPEHPKINAAWTGEKIRVYKDINIGIAADTDQGLVVPVIHGCGGKSFAGIAAERQMLVKKAREGCLLPEHMAGGTFTVSNLGMYGVSSFQAILNPPQSALLAVGGISKSLALENGSVTKKPIITMSLSCDHRVLDGAEGARFLQRLKNVMEKPEILLDADLFQA